MTVLSHDERKAKAAFLDHGSHHGVTAATAVWPLPGGYWNYLSNSKHQVQIMIYLDSTDFYESTTVGIQPTGELYKLRCSQLDL